MAGKGKLGPVPVCVGCETPTHDCRKSQVGQVCGACEVELRNVIRWQHQVRLRAAPPAVRVRPVYSGRPT